MAQDEKETWDTFYKTMDYQWKNVALYGAVSAFIISQLLDCKTSNSIKQLLLKGYSVVSLGFLVFTIIVALGIRKQVRKARRNNYLEFKKDYFPGTWIAFIGHIFFILFCIFIVFQIENPPIYWFYICSLIIIFIFIFLLGFYWWFFLRNHQIEIKIKRMISTFFASRMGILAARLARCAAKNRPFRDDFPIPIPTFELRWVSIIYNFIKWLFDVEDTSPL